MMSLLCLLFAACEDAMPVQDDLPAVSFMPFELVSHTSPENISPLEPVRLRWILRDTTIGHLRIWYQMDQQSTWYRVRDTIPAAALQYDFPVNPMSVSQWRFAISRTNGRDMDSTALLTIDRRQVFFVEPVRNALFFRSDSLRIHWRPKSEGINFVTIEIATQGKNNWHHGLTLGIADTVYTWVRPPFYAGGCNKMRISVQDWDAWSYVEGLQFVSFQINYPRKGDVLYRFLPVNIEDEIVIPDCMKPGIETRYEFSVDGGSSWREVERSWVVHDAATAEAMLRVTQPTLGVSETIGPFSIEDRSTAYFSLKPGMQFRYRHHGFRSSPGYHDTTWAEWVFVHVDDEIVRDGRTEYPCTITVEKDGGGTTVSTRLLWQEHEGQRLIKGDFQPFSMGEIAGIHDVSIDRTGGHTVHSSSPSHTESSSYNTVRDRGMTRASRSRVTGHVPPMADGHEYRLYD